MCAVAAPVGFESDITATKGSLCYTGPGGAARNVFVDMVGQLITYLRCPNWYVLWSKRTLTRSYAVMGPDINVVLSAADITLPRCPHKGGLVKCVCVCSCRDNSFIGPQRRDATSERKG